MLNELQPTIGRRRFGQLAIGAVAAAVTGGCSSGSSAESLPDKVWGRLGAGKGQFSKPRAIAIDANDNLYIVDMTARIQVFDADGNFIRVWQTPEQANGRPTGMTISNIDGNLMVADTHYYRVLTYTPQGELLTNATLGGTMGQGPGEFGFLTDVVRDVNGNYYVSEYGEFDRIQKFSPDGKFILQWGGHGDEPGHFMRPRANSNTHIASCWTARGTFTFASTETIACRSSHSTANRWPAGDTKAASRDSYSTPGRWCSIAAGAATCWIR